MHNGVVYEYAIVFTNLRSPQSFLCFPIINLFFVLLCAFESLWPLNQEAFQNLIFSFRDTSLSSL